jgi:hypothetical protein
MMGEFDRILDQAEGYEAALEEAYRAEAAKAGKSLD